MRWFFFLLFFISCSFQTISKVYFRNFCDHTLDIIQTEEFKKPTRLVTVPSFEKRLKAFEGGRVGFLGGWDRKTSAEFRFDENDQDHYYINVISGYDTPMKIAPYEGYAINCTSATCPDGVLFPHELDGRKVHALPAGSDFTIIFCPHA